MTNYCFRYYAVCRVPISGLKNFAVYWFTWGLKCGFAEATMFFASKVCPRKLIFSDKAHKPSLIR